jgi:integral membrane protein, MMPL family
VLVDAFVVRMTITPAVLTLLGDKAWWMPKWLDKLVPNMDVEGATLLDTLEEEAEQPADHDEQAETAKSTVGASS